MAKTTTQNTYKVAPGRTVIGDDGEVGPGGEVTLASDEGEKLQKLGFLLTDEGDQVVQTGGPAVNVEDGIQVKQA